MTKELVARWCIEEWVKRLAGNEIELGMKIPTIESRARNIQMTKGMTYVIITVWLIKIFIEYVGTNMSIQVPLLVIDRTRYHIHRVLTRYYEFLCFDVPKVVRSPRFDRGHAEESRNGRDVKINILEAYVWTSKWFRVSSGIYRSTGRLAEPSGSIWALLGHSGREEKGA